ncbi:MAG: HEAT repeat domain-containing protein, partial [Bacteroidetes bacterium]|nr:HEAT repeat domain-containing protein [Bacteroidota bacterium]
MRINKPFLLLGIFSGLVIQNCTPSNHPETEAEKQARLESFLNLSLEERRQLEHAMGSFVVGEGMEVELFAAEPMVVNPTNIDTDSRGRVWVCESFNYGVPEEKRTEKGGRIVILEDTDGDGKADKRTVFYQGEDVELALGIAVLGNQVFVTRSPDLLVFTDEDGDDKPDKKEKLLTGMGGPGDHSAHAVVFGPDGKLYFNMGNYGNEVHDKNGKLITDLAGREVIKNKEKYLGGMIFRLNMDGSEFETLGHNFRNNYEVAVDSYGNLWQSDNDDDGNKSVRINYILEYGNYGYLDEFTMESWYTPRTGMSDEIPRRHWHQNDPGVVPNVMITGAGSPGGILVYEGKMLPEVFHSQIIHADAGPNVVRGYISQKTGAGYQAKIQPIFQSKYDQWSRPIDVSVAPDGSVFACDWYDPIVGGGAAGDSEKGRIFRISDNRDIYRIKPIQPDDISKATEALKSPNLATRYIGWQYLHEQGKSAEKALMNLWENENPIFKARALWLLGKIEENAETWIQKVLQDANPDIRMAGIRLARQSKVNLVEVLKPLAQDSDPAVRREIAIALHLLEGQSAAELWTELA